MENPQNKWMITGGASILGTPKKHHGHHGMGLLFFWRQEGRRNWHMACSWHLRGEKAPGIRGDPSQKMQRSAQFSDNSVVFLW